MSPIQQVMTTDIADVERKMAKLQAEVLKLKDRLKEASAEGKKGHAEWKKGIEESTHSLAEMALEVTTVGGLIGAYKGAWQAWHEELKAIHATGKALAEDLTVALSASGKLGQGKRVEEFIELLSTGGYTKAQAQAAVLGVQAGAPELAIGRQEELARQAAAFTPMAAGRPEEIKAYGEMMGRIGRFMPNKSAEDLADLVQALRNRVGPSGLDALTNREVLGGVRTFVTSGAGTAEEALALATLAQQRDIAPKMIANLIAKVAAPLEEKKVARGEVAKPEDLAFNRFAVASPQARFRMALEDPEVQAAVLGERISGRFEGQLTMEDVLAGAQQLREAQAKDLAASSRRDLLKTEAGRAAAKAQRRRLEEQEKDRSKTGAAAYYEEIEHGVEEEQRGASPLHRFDVETAYRLFQIVEALREAFTGRPAVPETARLPADFEEKREEREARKEQTEAIRELNGTMKQAAGSSAAANAKAQGRE